MGNNRFLYDKMVREADSFTGIVSTDYHPSYPPENLRNIWTDLGYRTKYGANSGWGYFYFGSTSNLIYFDDTGAVARVATITVGNYDADSAIAEIETQMEAQTTDTFTVTYSDTSNKFTITNDTGTFELTCTLTTNAAWDYLGFDTASDKTGAAAYNSDSKRIHTFGGITLECKGGAAISATCAVLLGLNISSAYQSITLQRDVTGSWITVGTMTYDAATGVAYAFFSSVSSTKWRVVIQDWENSDGYIEIGTAVIGDYYTISKWFQHGFSEDVDDTTTHSYSKQGYVNAVIGYFKEVQGVTYEVLATDEGYLNDMYLTVGTRYPFVFVQDSDDVLNTLKYVMFAGKFSRRGKDAYTKEITLAWVGVK